MWTLRRSGMGETEFNGVGSYILHGKDGVRATGLCLLVILNVFVVSVIVQFLVIRPSPVMSFQVACVVFIVVALVILSPVPY